MVEEKVKIVYFGILQNLVGARDEQLEFPVGTTVSDILQDIRQRHQALNTKLFDEKGEIKSLVKVLLDEEDVEDMQGFDTPLSGQKKVSVILLLPQFHGG